MRLESHPEAELELIEAALHYEQEVPGLGEYFEAGVWRTTNLLLEHPEIGQALDSDLRRFVLPRFPFTRIYSAATGILRVEVVAHQNRLPGYWRVRHDR